MDENELDVIVDHAKVLPEAVFKSKQAGEAGWRPEAENTFYAGRFYDPTTKLFRSLHGTVQQLKYSKRYLRVAEEHGAAKLATFRKTAVTPGTVKGKVSDKKRKRDDDADATAAAASSSLEELPTDKFAAASAQLQLSAMPSELPCRDKEKSTILDFIETAIRNGGVNHALYISGE